MYTGSKYEIYALFKPYTEYHLIQIYSFFFSVIQIAYNTVLYV